MKKLYLIQKFDGETWKTTSVTSDPERSGAEFQNARVLYEFKNGLGAKFRQIELDVTNFDFLTTHARNFALLDKINF